MRRYFIVLFSSALAWGQPADLSKARQLESENKLHEAFQAYLTLPGAEYLAARIARPHPAEYLALIDPLLRDSEPALRARLTLVRGDLLLAAGDSGSALHAYRDVATAYVKRSDYPVEPPQSPFSFAATAGGLPRSNSGSHRDNWLIRRFVALQSWSDADAEYLRMWKVHRGMHSRDAEFPLALQFAGDYSSYLKQRGQADGAIAVLQEEILQLDLDRVMGYPVPRTGPYGLQETGVTAGEFLRLAYVEFTEAHRGKELLETLERSPQPAMKRVVAWVLLHQGDTQGALAKELQYIDESGWNGPSKAIRHGAIFEEFQRPAEAVSAYTSALAGKLDDLNLPDAEWIAILGASRPPATERTIRTNLDERLVRLEAAQGHPDGELAALSDLLEDEDRIAKFDWLQRTADRFQAAGRSAEFQELLRAQLPLLRGSAASADAHWFLGDSEAAAQDLARTSDIWDLDVWKKRFSARGTPQLHDLLQKLAAAHPKDLVSRLELLALSEPQDGPAAIRELEALIAPGMPASYSGFKVPRIRSPLGDVFDVAYRLSRIYERSRAFGKLIELGLRVARGNDPFRYVEGASAAHSVIAVALEHATQSELSVKFLPALAAPQWAPERAQLQWRNTAKHPPAAGRDFGWSEKLPPGVRVLASNEDVLALTIDAMYVYTGHPWGLAVYDHAGRPVTRVALAHPVFALAAGEDAVWAGTDKGLFRIALPSFEVSSIGAANLDQPITELALRAEFLWIGGRNLARLDTRSRELRLFAPLETGFEGPWTSWDTFFFDERYIWVRSGGGAHRFDTRTAAWAVPRDSQTGQQLHLIGLVDGILWGALPPAPVTQGFAVGGGGDPGPETLRDSPLYQIDRESLTAKRVQVLTSGEMPGDNYTGHLEGKPVFGRWFYDPRDGVLKRLVAWRDVVSEVSFPGAPSGEPWTGECSWRRPDGVSLCHAGPYRPCYLVRFPDGATVTAERNSSTTYTGNQESAGGPPSPAKGGLWFRTSAGETRHVSFEGSGASAASSFSDVLPFDRANQAVPSPTGETWIGTGRGVALVDGGFRIFRIFNSGPPGSHIVSLAPLGGKLYFAADAGMVEYDPKRAIFQVYTHADGLPNASVERVEASPSGQLEIVTAAFRRASDFKDVRYPPVLFDTKTRRFSPAGEPALIVRKPPAPPQPKMERAMPWLGGPVLADVTVGGKHVLCGTRGAVVLAGSETAKVAAVFDVRETGSLLDQRAAERLPLFRFTPEALAPLLRDTNPFVRMKALDTIARVQGNAAWVGILGSTIHDAFLPVRRLAVRAVANAGLADWRSFLEQGLSDADGQVQDSCAYGLAKLGTLVPLHYYESMLRRNEPYNPNSIPPIFDELAKQPTPEVMALLLRQRIGAYTDRVHDAGAGRIGSAVAGYPASVDLLLRSYRPGEVHWSQPTFPQAVLAAAGTAIRPQLLDALRTPDRVARSNAARALGLMGDRTAIPALLAALDLESGLSRVSIVWALGKLHASEAVPALSALYLAVAPRSDSMRGRAYMGQMTQGIVWGYGQFETVEALKANWDALKTAKTPEAPKGQFSGEDMLTTEQILAALKDIGGPSTRNFYRGLAASKDASVRYQAAVGLADAGPDNVDVLRGLMGDDDANTSSAAAVSLFLLGDEAGQPEVQRRMEQCDPSGTLLHELYRVTDVKRLAFLKAAAESCDVRGAVGFSGQYSVDRILGRPHR